MRRIFSVFLTLCLCLSLFMTFSVSASADTVEYTNTVVIYDITGSRELYSYSMSGDGVSPEFSLVVSATGCTISSSAGNAVYLFSGSDFAGFAVTPNGSVVYGIGGLLVGGGDESHQTYSLYVVQAVQEKEYEDSILGWIESVFDGIVNLPSKIWDFLRSGFDSVSSAIVELPGLIADALSFPEISALFEGFDFTPVTEFFTQIWDGFKTGFGLKTFIEDPNGPFGWLSDTSTADNGGSHSAGVLSALSAIGTVTGAIPSDIVSVVSLLFCAGLFVAFLKAF